MLRAITVLSVGILVILMYTGATRPTGETSKSRTLSNAQLIERFDKITQRGNAMLIRYDQRCPAFKSYIKQKRGATWRWQDATDVARTPTSYTERRATSCRYLKWVGKLWAKRAHKAYTFHVKLRDPLTAICHVFGSYCSQAVAVSSCETGGTFDIWADNGQYLGLFQMGSSERARYGHGNTAYEQTKAAHRYFVASGRDWSPWSCKPY